MFRIIKSCENTSKIYYAFVSITVFLFFAGVMTSEGTDNLPKPKTEQTSATVEEKKEDTDKAEDKQEEVSKLDKALNDNGYDYRFADIENGTHTEKIGEQLIVYMPEEKQTPETFLKMRNDLYDKVEYDDKKIVHNGFQIMTMVLVDRNTLKGCYVQLANEFDFYYGYKFTRDSNSKQALMQDGETECIVYMYDEKGNRYCDYRELL